MENRSNAPHPDTHRNDVRRSQRLAADSNVGFAAEKTWNLDCQELIRSTFSTLEFQRCFASKKRCRFLVEKNRVQPYGISTIEKDLK
jgi:hypothetical protein